MTKPTTTTIPTSQLKAKMKLWVANMTFPGTGTAYEVKGVARQGRGYRVALKNGRYTGTIDVLDSEVEIINNNSNQ